MFSPFPQAGGPSPLRSARQVRRVLNAADMAEKSLSFTGQPRELAATATAWVWAKNMSGAVRAEGEAVELGDSLFTDLDTAHPWFECDLKAECRVSGILLQSTPSEDMGRVLLAGACMALVDVVKEEHTHCTPVVGSPNPKSGFFGSWRIVWKPPGTGVLRAFILLGDPSYPPPFYWAKARTDMCPGDSFVDFYELEGIDGGINTACIEEELPAEVSVANELALAMCADERAIIIRTSDPTTSDPESDTWLVLMPTHKAQNVLYDASYADCALSFPRTSLSVMHCCPTPDAAAITLYEHTYLSDAQLVKTGYTTGTGSGTQTCEITLQGKYITLCAFEQPTTPSWTNLGSDITFTATLVVTDVYDDTGNKLLEQIQRYIYVLCQDDEFTPETIKAYGPCP